MTIQEIEQKLNECQKALAELKESKKEGKWKPKIEEIYWVRNSGGASMSICWLGTSADYWRYNNIPIFPTKTECERYCNFMDTVKEKSYEFSKDEWGNERIDKYYIFYTHTDNTWEISEDWVEHAIGTIYFKDKKSAQYIIDNFKDELMEYWL